MKKGLIVLVVALGVGLGGIAFAHGGGYGGYGGHMMGPGSGGHMMGPGDRGYCSNAPGTFKGTGTVTESDVKSILTNYIGGNPNLKVGNITDKETYFEGEIRTKEDSLVARLAIDKATGWVRPLN
ncbi:MAG: hypothetical protein ABID54_00965 [Pseudomonadota bacterium]